MIVRKITAYAVKAGKIYEMAGGVARGATLPGSDYMRFGSYPQLYSERSQAALIRVEADDGTVGWGESQAPIGTEVILTIVAEVLGPAILGREVEASNVRFNDMYETLRVRGQVGGYQMDAIAGIDTALWDLRGQSANRSVADLLGGRRVDRLPCYVTGLRSKTKEGRKAEAASWAEQGIGIKPCLGLGYLQDAREVEGLRSAIGDHATLLIDGMWHYDFPEAVRIGRVYEDFNVGFFESPLVPEDVHGHAKLARELDLAVAIGEPLRTRYQFLPWLEQQALDIGQPDLMRNGISETVKIAQLAEAFHVPIALHTGCLTVVGMAASWQVASTLPNFHIQEYQPVMLETFNPWLEQPLEVREGKLVVPQGPGLGISIDAEQVAAQATAAVTVEI
jgi:D-galactarolactone cycloisomerase